MIAIIGAGPAGNYTAYLLAKKNKEVSVFEEHKDIGLPIHCTGITTALLRDIIPVKKDFIINEVKKARIFAPNNRFIEISLKESNIILDRHKFDNYLADIAKQNGVRFFLNHKFLGNKDCTASVRDKESKISKEISFSHLIGADGPLSPVAKCNNLFRKRKFWQGIQARVKIKNENIVEFYPYFGTYAWLVPENEETARVGLVSEKYAPLLFKNFLFKFKNIKKSNIIEYQGGIIPKYDPKIKAQKNNIYIVGDAACHVKATTGGGIIQGLLASEALSDSIINSKNYDYCWRKSIGKELYLHLLVRKIMDRFKQKDWDKLINALNSVEVKKVIEDNERDNISKILLKIMIKKPSLLCLSKHILG